MITPQDMIQALENDFDVRAYSGRGMYGEQCVGVDTESVGDLMKVAAMLIDHNACSADDVIALGDKTCTDAMGLGVILYWPSLKLTAEQVEYLRDDDEDGESESEDWRTL
jgi:hypothetical protein